ncbi:hypothetical protein LCGC14_0655930 [marine sediment metagenome]|uniref:Dolichyl-phosphooligosaccharide-protein glycotransferase n=1 Tax=marine sediment metagenome TaxID=412755 RepID=A0A0F9R048_9ZZZZ
MKEEINQETKRNRKILDFLEGKFNWFVYLVLGIILWINIKIRILPMKINPLTGNPGLWDITKNNWTLGPDLDPFFFLRWAKMIIEQGAVPAIDTMRYVPFGYNTLLETKLLPYAIAYLYKFLHFFSDKVTIEYAAIILPVIASVFTTIAFFLLVRKIFEVKGIKISNIIALLASMFLITLPSLLSRTIAGIPEKESLGFGLMFFAFYFFLSAWKSEKILKALILGILSGIFTALMALVWGGVIFVFAVIAIAGFISFILGKIGKKELIVYSSWILGSIIFWLPFTLRTTLKGFVVSSTSGAAIIVWLFLIIYFVMFKTKLRNTKILQNPKINKIPRPILAIIISLIILIFLSSIFLSPKATIDFGGGLISKLSSPYSDRLSFTVAENRQPFFSDWKYNFGPVVRNIPLFFWLFFVGSIFLIYETIKELKKGKLIFVIGYILFLLALIFSRTSQASLLNGTSSLSIFVYILGYLILIISAFYIFYKNEEKEAFKNIKFEYILVFSLIFIGIIAARSTTRLIMLLAPIAVIPISYLTVTVIANIRKKKGDLTNLFFVVFTVLLFISVPYTIYYNYKVSEVTGKNLIPTQYTNQWQEAMGWVRENTPSDAVFASWWDYGYWIQTMGERATMLDGGNNIIYWDYLMGRHVLTAETEAEALELLYNHEVTHFLIDSTDIGKYGAYSSIGSDENYDRLSYIGTFILDGKQTQETKNKTTLVYLGGATLDEDIIINGGSEILPKGVAGVGALVISLGIDGEFEQPIALVVSQEKQYSLKLRYLFYNGKLVDFDSGIDGGAYIFPVLNQGTQGITVNPMGASMFLSPRNMRALWVRMYLLEEGENFNLVHTEPNQIIKSLRAQGLSIGDIVYFQGIMGPIKIWEVNYTGDEKHNEEYLERTYPERIKERRYAK